MDSLDKAIKKLNNLKSQVSSLPKLPEVPTIKAPPVPSMTATNTQKLPGVAPSTNKDPKKVADQLKAGQPQKPKLKEVLKTDLNGQWSLLEKHDWSGGKAKIHGWISPTGEYHHMEPHESHSAKLYRLLGKKPNTTLDKKGFELHPEAEEDSSIETEAKEKGWIQVGIGGQESAYGDHAILANRSHPASKKLREIMSQNWSSGELYTNHPDYESPWPMDTNSFSKFGSLKPKV